MKYSVRKQKKLGGWEVVFRNDSLATCCGYLKGMQTKEPDSHFGVFEKNKKVFDTKRAGPGEKKRRGQPRKHLYPKSVNVSASAEEVERWREKAKAEGMGLSPKIRELMNAWAR